jgi:hypothetical protein
MAQVCGDLGRRQALGELQARQPVTGSFCGSVVASRNFVRRRSSGSSAAR